MVEQNAPIDHHPNCYQTTGVPADLPPGLCDCSILRMLDDDERGPHHPDGSVR